VQCRGAEEQPWIVMEEEKLDAHVGRLPGEDDGGRIVIALIT
jgi:hypothetical protein